MDGTFKIWTFNQSISVTLSEKHFYCPKVEILRFILFICVDVSDYLQVSTTVIKCRFGPAGKLYSSSLPRQTCFILALGIWTHKVHIFWEDHEILWKLHRRFVLSSAIQIYGGHFATLCGLLRIYELYLTA